MRPSVQFAESSVTGLIARWSETSKWYRRIAKTTADKRLALRAEGRAEAYEEMIEELGMLQRYLRGEDIEVDEE